MAAGRLPKPGTEFGPCVEDCNHIDCAETRSMVAVICGHCQKSIGYETRFYKTNNHGEPTALVHANCLEDKIEADRVAALEFKQINSEAMQ
jgi:hypothetical protein